MNLKDLYTINEKTIGIIERNDPSPSINELVNHLASMRTNPTPEVRDTINTLLKTVSKNNVLIETELSVLPHINFLEENTDLKKVIGLEAATELRRQVSEDPYFSADSISSFATNIANYLAFLRDTNRILALYGIKSQEEDLPVVSFELAGEIDIETTGELIYRLGDIESIMHGFARLTGDPEAFAKPQIRSMSKSSPLIIDIGTALKSTELHLFMLAKGITWVLSRIEQVQNIQIQHEKLKQTKITNEMIDNGFKELENGPLSKESIRNFVTEELIADPSAVIIDGDGAGSEEEVIKGLVESVKKLVILFTKGATAKVYLPPPDDPAQVMEKRDEIENFMQQDIVLRRTVQIQGDQIKRLESGEITSEELEEL